MTKKSSIAVAMGLALITMGIPVGEALAYAPGTATGRRPTYNWQRGGYEYGCNFSGWRSGAKVVWKCDLMMRSMSRSGQIVEGLVANHSGSWTPGSTSYRTPTWFKARNLGDAQYCVKTYAYSVDGYSPTRYACN